MSTLYIFVVTFTLACFHQVATEAVLDYDHSFDPTTHTESGKKEYHLDLDSMIDGALTSESQLRNLYYHYTSKYEVSHGNHEYEDRLQIFRQYLLKVQRLRQDDTVTWTAGITFMGHMTDCEKNLFKLGNRTDHTDHWNPAKECSDPSHNEVFEGNNNGLQAGSGLPDQFDWRGHGAVTPVKDQGSSNNCWTFAAVTVMEAWLMKLTGGIEELSTQELADCVYYGHKKHFPGGGWPHDAWNYVKIEKRLGYRYQIPERLDQEGGGSCSYGWTNNALADYGVEIDKVNPLTGMVFSAEQFMQVVYKVSPIAVIIKVDDDLADSYKRGPYDPRTSNCAGAPSHAVAITGYDQTYFYIKNSWGADWGNDGYIWWIRAPGKETCGLYSQGSFVYMKKTKKKTEKTEKLALK